jgi:hypothetical protein
MQVRSTKAKQMDREIGLMALGAVAVLFGVLLLMNSQSVAQKMFQCVQVQSLDGPKTVVTCETAPSSTLAVEIAGGAFGICGILTVLVGAVNWAR